MNVFFQLVTGSYLFIETSSPRQSGDKATILTPYLNDPQCMKFSYHMYGSHIGDLKIYANNQRIFSKSGNQGNQWVGVEMPILQSGRYMVSKESGISDTQTIARFEGPEETSVRTSVILFLGCTQPERLIQCCCWLVVQKFRFQEPKRSHFPVTDDSFFV